jgi:solute carrier family 25 2-oxodicarboxylate transporter 21
VVKTRIQIQTTPISQSKYNWVFPGVATVAREEGVRALYKGTFDEINDRIPAQGA